MVKFLPDLLSREDRVETSRYPDGW